MFALSTLSMPVNTVTIAAIKAELSKYYPDIKSSHRVEALARALGFSTNAALRAALKEGETLERDINWEGFRGYLGPRNISVEARPLYLVLGRSILKSILDEYPTLTYAGIGVNTSHYKGETEGAYLERFQGERVAMLRDASVEQFLRSYVLVSLIPKSHDFEDGRGAYGLKHTAENMAFAYPDGAVAAPEYVSTGSVIFAAVHAGFKYHKHGEEYQVVFNMCQSSIKTLDREIRPRRYDAA